MSDEHLGGAYLDCYDGNTWMPDVWCYLIKKYSIKSVIDVGCGAGWVVQWFNQEGVLCVGVEGWEKAFNARRHPMMVRHDYTHGPLTCGDIDLAWCAEFVEHVEEQFIPNYMETFRCCRYVCMTHGEPGQAGEHHVCLRSSEWWIGRMLHYRFILDQAETDYLRSTDTYHAPWGRRTLMFFRNDRFPVNT